MAGYDRLDVRPWQPKCPQLFPARFCSARQQRHAPLAPSQMSCADQRNPTDKDERGRGPEGGSRTRLWARRILPNICPRGPWTGLGASRGNVGKRAEKGNFFRRETTETRALLAAGACNPSFPPARAGQTKQMPEPVPPLCAVISDVTQWRRRTSWGLAGR